MHSLKQQHPVWLSPETAKALIDAGYTVRVEESSDQIYKVDEFKAVGAEIVPAGSWVNAPTDEVILGLKEIQADGTSSLAAHRQAASSTTWEFLTDETGRRVAVFGYWAGYAGTALALLSWAHQLLHPGVPQGPVPIFNFASALTDLVKSNVQAALADLFPEVASSDIFVNCVYLGANKTPPFTTFESLSGPERRPRVICNVSCDPNSENNPIPVYSTYSSFKNPTAPGFWPP
ncbi:hypothetical protein CDV31_006688 [Fusarium ambrosium]|uniref:Alanine dehydrogenase/pyridine nucleotide transhydrogenase N-terminal domain-containing protein n=1 Tax=Fusarium ambrosium TaxID=131363 RepID=A0A428UBC4_9HYPO|nr:hypothetical protein CDV31_006688 [Fusarium ambrosium]